MSRPKGIFKTFFHYLHVYGEEHLENTIVKKINGRPQTEKTLNSILVEGGLSPDQAKKLIHHARTATFKKFKGHKKVSPSFEYYKGKRKLTNPTPLQGGSTGLVQQKIRRYKKP